MNFKQKMIAIAAVLGIATASAALAQNDTNPHNGYLTVTNNSSQPVYLAGSIDEGSWANPPWGFKLAPGQSYPLATILNQGYGTEFYIAAFSENKPDPNNQACGFEMDTMSYAPYFGFYQDIGPGRLNCEMNTHSVANGTQFQFLIENK